MTNKNKYSLERSLCPWFPVTWPGSLKAFVCHILLRDFVMSRCRQLTFKSFHVVGMELMYEKTFNSSQPCRNLQRLVVLSLCFECNYSLHPHFSQLAKKHKKSHHAQPSWLSLLHCLGFVPEECQRCFDKDQWNKRELTAARVPRHKCVKLFAEKNSFDRLGGCFPARHGNPWNDVDILDATSNCNLNCLVFQGISRQSWNWDKFGFRTTAGASHPLMQSCRLKRSWTNPSQDMCCAGARVSLVPAPDTKQYHGNPAHILPTRNKASNQEAYEMKVATIVP